MPELLLPKGSTLSEASPIGALQWDAASALPNMSACVELVRERQLPGWNSEQMSCLALIVYCPGIRQRHLACAMCIVATLRACSEYTRCSSHGYLAGVMEQGNLRGVASHALG